MVATSDRLHKDFLAPLIHALMAKGSFGKMAEDAKANAMRLGRKPDADLYDNIRNQIADYYAQVDTDGL